MTEEEPESDTESIGADIDLLLTEARTELDRQQRELNKITNRAVRNIQFAAGVLTLILGVAKFGSQGPVEITTVMLVGGIGLLTSIILSIIAIGLPSIYAEIQNNENTDPLLSVEAVKTENDDESGDESKWVSKRLDYYSERINSYSERRRVAGDITIWSVVIGFTSGVILLVSIVDQVDQIQRFELPWISEPLPPIVILVIAGVAGIAIVYRRVFSYGTQNEG